MNLKNLVKPSKGKAYILLSFSFWLIAEFITVWHDKLSEWVLHMPLIFVYYVGYPLLFHYFIFRRNWNERRIFILMLAVSLVLEISWGNPLLLNPISCIPALFLLLSIYGFITFIPLWIVNGTFFRNRVKVVYCFLWILVVLVVLVLTRLK